MKLTSTFLILAVLFSSAILSIRARELLADKVAPAPGPVAHSQCKLPTGQTVSAPEEKTGAQALYYYRYYSYTYYTSYYYSYYYYYGRRHLLQSTETTVAPSASAVPACCPTQNVKQGDTVEGLLSGKNLADGQGLFYALNPDVSKDAPLKAGTTVTVPCYRILAYLQETAPPAPVPAPSTSGTSGATGK